MTNRWPNTQHWQRLEAAFRATNGSRWRTAAAQWLGCERRDLRAMVDRDMSAEEIERLNADLVAQLHSYANFLQEYAERTRGLARSIAYPDVEEYIDTAIEKPIILEPGNELIEFDFDNPAHRQLLELLEAA
jgi:hypothetical protein